MAEAKNITTGNLRTNAKKETSETASEPANGDEAEEITDQEQPPN